MSFADGATQTTASEVPQEVVQTARLISAEVIDCMIRTTHGNVPEKNPSPQVETMKRVVAEILIRYSSTFVGFSNGLTVNSDETLQSFERVVDEIFADNEVNWGRIATVYAYGCKMAVEADKAGSQEYVTRLKRSVGDYTGHRLGAWISEHGGWDGFVNFFEDHQTALEDSLRSAMTWTALGLGLAGFATVAIMAVKS